MAGEGCPKPPVAEVPRGTRIACWKSWGALGKYRGVLEDQGLVLFCVLAARGVSTNTSGNTAACDHPRPRTGVGTLLALGIGGFVTGPTGPGTWQPSWSSTPPLGAWPCLRGASAPTLPVQQGAQCDVVRAFLRSKIGARRHRSHDLTFSVPGQDPCFATEPSTMLHLFDFC